MKIKIKETDVLMLNQLKGKMLLKVDTAHSHRLYTIMRYKTEEITETVMEKPSIWKKAVPVQKTQLYLTGADVNAWHSQGKFLGTLSDESAEWLLRRDLYDLRQNWIDFCDQLKAFGLKVVEIPEESSTPVDMEKVAEKHLKEFFKTNGYENQQDIIKYAVSFAKSLK